jgi:hypothetical protein
VSADLAAARVLDRIVGRPGSDGPLAFAQSLFESAVIFTLD